MGAQTYRIAHISDLLKVPSDRRGACLREIEMALEFHELAGAEGLVAVDWTDDGDKSVDLLGPNGEMQLSLRVQEAGAGEAPKALEEV